MALNSDGSDRIPVSLNDGHWAEALQTACIIQSNHQAFLVDHPAISQTPSLAGRAEVISRLLGDLYQAIGEAAGTAVDTDDRP